MAPVAAILAVLMLAKFIIVKPISFLLLAVLFAVSAYLVFKRNRAGTILLLVLAAVAAVVFGAHLIDKGFDPGAYQNTTDFIVILVGFPLSLVAIAGAVIALREGSRSTVSDAPG